MSSSLHFEHQSLVDDLCGLHEKGRLPHALLLTSDSGVGLSEVSLNLAESLLRRSAHAAEEEINELLSAGTHGDFRWLSVVEGKASIGVEQVRTACEFIAKTAGYGSLKVLAIEESDRLTIAAANALLKTLEEPQGNTLIILMTRRPWLLPATVRSRCQTRTIPRLKAITAKSELEKLGLQAESYAKLAPRHLENWIVAASSGTLESRQEVHSILNQVLEGRAGGRELTDCLMKHELIEAVEAVAVALEVRLTETEVERQKMMTLMSLHRLVASLLQRIRNGATPAREVACYEIGVLTAGASENKINAVAEGLSIMGVARL